MLLMAVRHSRSAPREGSVGGQPDLGVFMVEHDLRGLSSLQQSIAHQSLGEAVRRAARRGNQIRYVQRILAAEESRCLCLFEAPAAGLVRSVNDMAQFPLARLWPSAVP